MSDQTIGAGGMISGITLYSGDTLTVGNGGTASGITIDGGATEIVVAGGTDEDSLIRAGGTAIVSPTGTATGTVVDGGGLEDVEVSSVYLGKTYDSGVIIDYYQLEGGVSGTNFQPGATELIGVPSNEYDTSISINSSDLRIQIGPIGGLYQYEGVYTQTISDVNESYSITGPTGDETEIQFSGPPCYLSGTRINSAIGELPIESLTIGDLLLTHTGHLRPIIWIGRRNYAGRFAASNPGVMPVRIRANALADAVPRRDLFVSPQHAMFLDGMLIPAIYLVNGASIVRVERMEQVDYFHLELETHDVILAEGAPSETFVDCDSRTMFQNAHEFAALYPDDRSTGWAFCAPRVEDGEQLEAVRRRIAARAGLGADHVDDALKAGPLEGRIDLLDHTTIAGWAFDAARPHTPVRLEILVDDAVIGETLANLHRDDLRQAGKGEGRCAFSHHLAHALTPSAPHVVQMRRIDDQAALLEIPLLLAAEPAQPGPLDGRIDVSDDTCVAGWAVDISRPDIPVRLEIVAEGNLIGQTLAGRYRPDLDRAGLVNGRCSFMFRYGLGGAPCDPNLVQVRRASDQATLPMH